MTEHEAGASRGSVVACELCKLPDALHARGMVVERSADWITYVHPEYGGSALWIQASTHVEGLWSLGPSHADSLGPALVRSAAALRAEASAERVYTISMGENHQHFHALLLARGTAEAPGLKGPALLRSYLNNRHTGRGEHEDVRAFARSLARRLQ